MKLDSQQFPSPYLHIKTAAGGGQWRYVHNKTSDFVMILAGLHLAINWDWFIAASKRFLRFRGR